jgi:hypothetical protein
MIPDFYGINNSIIITELIEDVYIIKAISYISVPFFVNAGYNCSRFMNYWRNDSGNKTQNA